MWLVLAGCATGPKHEPPAPIPETISIETDGLFDFDSTVIKPELAAKLDSVAEKIAGREYNSVEIVGHTCSIGSEAYNQGLSERRAQSTADYLAGKGVDSSKISARGEGEMNPAHSNDTEAGRAKNRRIEVTIRSSILARTIRVVFPLSLYSEGKQPCFAPGERLPP